MSAMNKMVTLRLTADDVVVGTVERRIPRFDFGGDPNRAVLNDALSVLRAALPDAKSIGVEVVEDSPECGCGHPYHDSRPCTGTLYTVSDSTYVVMAMREGRKPAEPCACIKYEPI